MARIPCPNCSDGFTTHEDRHARTAKDVCPTCKGDGTIDVRTDAVRAVSFDPTTGRPFGEVRAVDGART